MLAKASGVIGIPTFGTVSMQFTMALRHLGVPLVTTYIDYPVFDKRIDHARNDIVEFALKSKVEWVLFFDDDVIFPPDTLMKLHKLLKHGYKMVTGVYWSKSDPTVPLMFRDHMMGPYYDWHVGEMVKIDAAGVGCTMIDIEVFKKIPPPWFSIEYTSSPAEMADMADIGTTEDLYFYKKAKDYGFQLWADTSIQCGHYDKYSKKIFGLTEDMPQAQAPGTMPTKRGNKKILDIGAGHQSPYFPEGIPDKLDIRDEGDINIRADARHLPIKDETYDIVFSSHTLEHFAYWEVLNVLAEWIRVLKVGGELRLVVPNVQAAARAIAEGKFRSIDMWIMYGQQEYPENFHKSGFTPETMKEALLKLGNLKDIYIGTRDYNASGRVNPAGDVKDFEIIVSAKKAYSKKLESIAPPDYLIKDPINPLMGYGIDNTKVQEETINDIIKEQTPDTKGEATDTKEANNELSLSNSNIKRRDTHPRKGLQRRGKLLQRKDSSSKGSDQEVNSEGGARQ